MWGYNVSEHTCDLVELFFNAFGRIPTMIYKQAQGHSSLGVQGESDIIDDIETKKHI